MSLRGSQAKMNEKRGRSTLLRHLLQAGIAIGLINFAVSCFGVLYFGGVANIMPNSGPYFLDNHGHLTEVPRSVSTWLRWEELSVLVTHPVAAFCWWRMKKASAAQSTSRLP
jgi:hypothetical protein